MVKPGKEEIACMLRSYHLTHLSDAGKAEKILHEMDGLEGMHSARISADLKELMWMRKKESSALSWIIR